MSPRPSNASAAAGPAAPPAASRLARVAPFLAMDVLSVARAKARQGADIVHMEVGQPSAPTPRRALEAARAALAHGGIGYTEALGMPSLRERIARHYRETYGVSVDPEQVIVTTGSSGGFLLAFLAAFDAGARIACACPGYPAYRNIFSALDMHTVDVRLGDNRGWELTVDGIASAAQEQPLHGVLAMSPSNPTGAVAGAAGLEAIGAFCRERGLWFISDEIYHGLHYGAPATTALACAPEAIVVNSFSKYYCMTGWRIGWLVVPPRLTRAIERLAQNLFISAPYPSQVAAEAAFDARDELEEVRAGYARNRDIVLNALADLNLPHAPCDGAFYAYVDISGHAADSAAFCRALLDAEGLAITPGADFDPHEGDRFVRLSFAGATGACREGMARLKRFLTRGGA
ncbi:pyridoxal phosphate-dependent aminotransferase [Camelimonas abortus]|uniref:aspartate transaminase n=1 Tax=Camelimonas abortus TaxID=1017184 RepID=A0ABV7LFB4_9HYPH